LNLDAESVSRPTVMRDALSVAKLEAGRRTSPWGTDRDLPPSKSGRPLLDVARLVDRPALLRIRIRSGLLSARSTLVLRVAARPSVPPSIWLSSASDVDARSARIASVLRSC
jgi:hypothetical protein